MLLIVHPQMVSLSFNRISSGAKNIGKWKVKWYCGLAYQSKTVFPGAMKSTGGPESLHSLTYMWSLTNQLRLQYVVSCSIKILNPSYEAVEVLLYGCSFLDFGIS